MKETITRFKKEVILIDKFLIIFISLIPLFLAVSIFVADFLASLSGLILLSILIKDKKNLEFFKHIKKEIFFFLVFYIIILISLILSDYKNHSFLASFFYFRYILIVLSIFYLLKKYEFFLNFFFYIFFISILFVIFDSILQLVVGYNIIGYPIGGILDYGFSHLTSFFGTEKKLGSYLVRLLPLLLSLFYFYNLKISNKHILVFLMTLGPIVYLTSERTALLMLFLIFFCYLVLSKERILFIFSFLVIFSLLFYFSPNFVYKYTSFTLKQTGLKYLFKESPRPVDKDFARYYSYEHENLIYTGFINFKNNPFFGSGVKTFHQECRKRFTKFQYKKNERNNRLTCSTHPHNLFIQILSETGIFAFLMAAYFFIKITLINLKIFFLKNKDNLQKSYFFINLSIILNLIPILPSGSFFNNWMSLIMFFPLGFWLYIKNKIQK